MLDSPFITPMSISAKIKISQQSDNLSNVTQ